MKLRPGTGFCVFFSLYLVFCLPIYLVKNNNHFCYYLLRSGSWFFFQFFVLFFFYSTLIVNIQFCFVFLLLLLTKLCCYYTTFVVFCFVYILLMGESQLLLGLFTLENGVGYLKIAKYKSTRNQLDCFRCCSHAFLSFKVERLESTDVGKIFQIELK